MEETEEGEREDFCKKGSRELLIAHSVVFLCPGCHILFSMALILGPSSPSTARASLCGDGEG